MAFKVSPEEASFYVGMVLSAKVMKRQMSQDEYKLLSLPNARDFTVKKFPPVIPLQTSYYKLVISI